MSQNLDCVPSKAGQGRRSRRFMEERETSKAYTLHMQFGRIERTLFIKNLLTFAEECQVSSSCIEKRSQRNFHLVSSFALRCKKRAKSYYIHVFVRYFHFLCPRISYLHFPARWSKTLGNRRVFVPFAKKEKKGDGKEYRVLERGRKWWKGRR